MISADRHDRTSKLSNWWAIGFLAAAQIKASRTKIPGPRSHQAVDRAWVPGPKFHCMASPHGFQSKAIFKSTAAEAVWESSAYLFQHVASHVHPGFVVASSAILSHVSQRIFANSKQVNIDEPRLQAAMFLPTLGKGEILTLYTLNWCCWES